MDRRAGRLIAAAGVWIGVDVGTVRVGVARSDPRGVLAVPVTTLTRDRRGGSDVRALAALAGEYDAVGIVVGLPRTLAGREGPSARMAREYVQALEAAVPGVAVQVLDERLTTVSADRTLAGQGVRGRARRSVIDQAAAVVLLQHWLDGARDA